MKDPKEPLDAWPAQEPPRDFAERVLEAAREGAGEETSARTSSPSRASVPRVRAARRAGIIGALVLAAAAGAALWPSHRAGENGESIAADRLQVSIGRRAAAVLEPGAHVAWRGDDVTQSAGDVFYRVEPGAPFRVHTPTGDVTALGTCFRVRIDGELDADASSSRSLSMNKRDVKSAAVGAAIAGFAMVAVYEGKVAVTHAGQAPTTLTAGQTARADGDGVHRRGGDGEDDADPAGEHAGAGADVAYAEANKNLAGTVKEYQSRLTANEEERKTLQERLASAEAKLAAAANDGAAGPTRSEWEISQADWARMAKEGVVKYRLPCADYVAWELTPDKLDKLGLAPTDAPALKAAYAKSSQRVWGQVKSLCAEALGSVEVAEKLGRSTCSQLIMDMARRADGDGADDTMRQVAEIRAGLRPMPPAGAKVSPMLRLFLVLTGENGAFEQDLAQTFGPEEAKRLATTDGMCNESSRIRGNPPRTPSGP
jgi:hypothetical protein